MIVLMYHALAGQTNRGDACPNRYDVDESAFERHVQIVHNSGMQVVRFGMLDSIEHGKDGCVRLVTCFTFDDGHRSFLRAAGVLAGKGLAGTFFLVRDHCEERAEYLDHKEIGELVSMGMEVGTHGCSHRPLSRLADGDLYRELRDGKRWLEDIVSAKVDTMSVPGGFCGQRVVRAAREVGYRLIGTSLERVCRAPVRGIVVPRVCMRRMFTDKVFMKILNEDRMWLLGRRVRQGVLAVTKGLTGRGSGLRP